MGQLPRTKINRPRTRCCTKSASLGADGYKVQTQVPKVQTLAGLLKVPGV